MEQIDLDKAIKKLPDAGTYPGEFYYCTIISGFYIVVLKFKKKSIFLEKIGRFTIWTFEGVK